MSTEDTPLHDRIRAVERVAADEERLLTIAVPADESLSSVHARVEEDHAEASYIDTDDATNRQTAALERARRVLSEYEETPDNGFVSYVGVVDGEPTDWTFDDLPDPVTESRYAWANAFDTAPLDALVGPSRTDGLVVVERGGAALGRLNDGRVEVVETFDSDVMGKTKAGGQSAERFERERARQRDAFFEEVHEAAEHAFLDRTTAERATDEVDAGDDADATEGVDGLLVGGTTGTVERFVDDLPSRLDERLLGDAFAVEYANERGLERLAELGADRVADVERRGPREALERLFEAAREDDGEERVAYGREAVEEALTYEAVETLLLAESLRTEVYRALEERATEQGGEVLAVPTDVDGGERFVEGFDGRGALLRFPVE
jgi:peptide chain release factor subunit 1